MKNLYLEINFPIANSGNVINLFHTPKSLMLSIAHMPRSLQEHPLRTVTQRSCMIKFMHWVNNLSFWLFLEPTGMWIALHWCGAFIKPVVLYHNLCDAHDIVVQSLLNIPVVFSWVLPNVRQILMQYCYTCSFILWNWKSDECWVH